MLLLGSIMNEHRVIAPAADAEKLLRRLLWFNLTWGVLSPVTQTRPMSVVDIARARLDAFRAQNLR